ncbi:MAG: hypothetical protein IT445_05650 [Phycisphaeraceae bacterium]|nr:hypothetical protein [Phycisphaeraceae bacterium]
MTFQPLIIAAPFGNYIQPPKATATLGTFTALKRGGRVWRIIKTVRYYPRKRAWVNRIGLRNPGIDWLARRVSAGKTDLSDKIVSIHGFDDQQWFTLLAKLTPLKPLAVELNMSCPNVGHIDWPADLFTRAVGTGLTVVVKLPPVRYEQMLEQAMAAGVPWLHCCNTLPVPQGGMSGQPLKPESLTCIRQVRKLYGDRVKIIGGGGIYQPTDIDDYAEAGADRFSIATKLFNPKYLWSCAGIQTIVVRAAERAR